MIPKSWRRTAVAVALVSSFLVLLPPPARACGPFFTDTIFVYTKHPDFPLERFAGGQVGVLQPSYARSYLVAAYRNLIGERLTETEVAALKSLWDDRLNNAWDSADTDWIKKWNDARAKVPGVTAVTIDVYRAREKPNEYETFLNCQQDAFQNAEATLVDRIKRFGADSTNVREWLKAQDVVFSNCREGSQIPEAAPANFEASARADRAYQIAAANFYATHFDEAAKQFDAIARDASSPWRDVAGYLAARSFLRKGSLADKEEAGKPALAEAESRLKSIVNDKALTRSHHAATRLLSLTRLRLRPEEKLHELAQAIVKKNNDKEFKQIVWDYTLLLDKFVVDDDEVKFETTPAAIRNDDLTDWILTFQSESAAATSHALERWQATKSAWWLVAAIEKVKGSDAQAVALMDAAARIDHESSAFPTLVFHRVRLLGENNRGDEARTTLDQVLGRDRKTLTPSALNLLLSQRMMLAQNLNEFLQNALRVPAGFSDNNDGREIPDENEPQTGDARLFFDADAALIFNSAMPIATIAEAARQKPLPVNLHRDVAQGAFMRAALLDDRATAIQMSAVLVTTYPELKELLAGYERAATPEARRFAAAYLALKFPGLRPFITAGVNRTSAIGEMDSYRNNWWCAEPPTSFTVRDDTGESKPRTITPPEFLKHSQSVAARQAATLRAFGTAPNYFSQTAINWGTKNPRDPRVPEALHLAVKATRYGCTDDDTGRWSKAAFDFLHRRYPNTSWAKETKYWFKG